VIACFKCSDKFWPEITQYIEIEFSLGLGVVGTMLRFEDLHEVSFDLFDIIFPAKLPQESNGFMWRH
jgi:hypothetical protein